MTNIDQFESVFKAADKPQFTPESVRFASMLVITTLEPERARSFEQHATEFFGRELGVALDALERTDEAIIAARKALADTPNSIANLEMLGILLPQGQKQEIAQHFAKLRNPSDAFQYLADSFESYEEAQSLDVLVKAMKKIDENEPFLDYYQVVVLALN